MTRLIDTSAPVGLVMLITADLNVRLHTTYLGEVDIEVEVSLSYPHLTYIVLVFLHPHQVGK